MKNYFYMAVAAIAVLSSCSSDNEFEQSQTGKQPLVFTATMEGSQGKRAIFDETNYCAEWEVGDEISINGKIYKAQAAGTTTTFEAATEGQEAIGPYNAYFPANFATGYNGTLPANIDMTFGKFNMPMYAYSDNTTLAFTNLCGVLQITVDNNSQLASVKSITISSTNKGISGEFSVEKSTENENAYYVALKEDYKDNPANTLTVTYTEPVTTNGNGMVFYVAIPPETYENLSIAISDGTNTMVMTTKKSVGVTVERNKIYPINFNGQLTAGEAEITGAPK